MVEKRHKRDLSIKPRSHNLKIIADRIQSLDDLGRNAMTASTLRQRMDKEVLNGRRNALRASERALRSNDMSSPSIFISYSGSGAEYADVAKSKAAEYGFSIKTGFGDEVDIGFIDGDIVESLPQLIMAQIISSTFFLGIWTSDFQAQSIAGRDGRGSLIEVLSGAIPSVWMPFELGVAAAHDIKIRLLVQSGTHKGYYEKPFNLKPNLLFSPTTFEKKLESVMKYFEKRLRSQIMAGV